MPVSAERGTTFVRVDRPFDVAEAHTLREALALFAPVKDVVIDFSRARVVEDAALPVLAEILAALTGARVVLRGLTLHQRRLLRYIRPASVVAA
jgi:hypothetical protein